MRTISIFDILMLYGWNPDHYLFAVHGITPQKYSIPACSTDLFFGFFNIPNLRMVTYIYLY